MIEGGRFETTRNVMFGKLDSFYAKTPGVRRQGLTNEDILSCAILGYLVVAGKDGTFLLTHTQGTNVDTYQLDSSKRLIRHETLFGPQVDLNESLTEEFMYDNEGRLIYYYHMLGYNEPVFVDYTYPEGRPDKEYTETVRCLFIKDGIKTETYEDRMAKKG